MKINIIYIGLILSLLSFSDCFYDPIGPGGSRNINYVDSTNNIDDSLKNCGIFSNSTLDIIKVEQLIDQDLMDYVNKCSQHLFITEVSKRFFHTRFVDTKFGKRIMVLEFDGVKTPYIKLLNPERQWKESFKRNQFPLHMEDKKTSIKFFKAMKEKIADILSDERVKENALRMSRRIRAMGKWHPRLNNTNEMARLVSGSSNWRCSVRTQCRMPGPTNTPASR